MQFQLAKHKPEQCAARRSGVAFVPMGALQEDSDAGFLVEGPGDLQS